MRVARCCDHRRCPSCDGQAGPEERAGQDLPHTPSLSCLLLPPPLLARANLEQAEPCCKTNSCVGGRGSVLHMISIKCSMFGKHEGRQSRRGGDQERLSPASGPCRRDVSGSCAAFKSPKVKRGERRKKGLAQQRV